MVAAPRSSPPWTVPLLELKVVGSWSSHELLRFTRDNTAAAKMLLLDYQNVYIQSVLTERLSG